MSTKIFILPSSRIAPEQNGFTLIEVFIAIFLLTVSLLGTAALTTGVIRGNQASRNLTTATALAESCLEENRRVGYSNAGAVPAGGSNNCVSGTATVNSGGVTFTRTLTIDTSVGNIKTLTVAVSWSEGAVGTKSVSLVTILAAVS
jgi:prepilin-type N-terminal cleavage/methylation domain-containing protein